jgi:hypothetical protein
MSDQIDAFCDNLRDKLNEVDRRLQKLKASAKADSEKVRRELDAQETACGQVSMEVAPQSKRPRPE